VSIQAKTVHHENTLQTEQSRRSLDIKSAAEILIGISHREEEQQEHTQQQSGKECLKKGSFRTHHNSKRTTRHSSHMQDLEFASGATHIVNDRPYSKVIVPSISQLPTVLPPELEDDSSAHSTPSLTGFGNMGVDMLMLTL
jgi:hypothetical protein